MAEAASPIPHGVRNPEAQTASPDPEAFEDLLYLASLAWEAPRVLLAIPHEDGRWSLHGAGERHTPVLDRRLLDLVCADEGPVEVEDLLAARPDSPLAAFPHSMRWVYGLAVRDQSGRPVAVLAVMDRWIRPLTGRDRRVMQLVARQVRSRLHGPVAGATAGVPARAAVPEVRAQTVAALGPERSARLDVQAKLLRSSEVAALFDVTERTVINWAAAGKVPSIRTVGGHLRFRQDDIMAMVSGLGQPRRSQVGPPS